MITVLLMVQDDVALTASLPAADFEGAVRHLDQRRAAMPPAQAASMPARMFEHAVVEAAAAGRLTAEHAAFVAWALMRSTSGIELDIRAALDRSEAVLLVQRAGDEVVAAVVGPQPVQPATVH